MPLLGPDGQATPRARLAARSRWQVPSPGLLPQPLPLLGLHMLAQCLASLHAAQCALFTRNPLPAGADFHFIRRKLRELQEHGQKVSAPS